MARQYDTEPVYREEDFVADGALRDVCVLDATIDDWRRMFDGLPAALGRHVLTWTLSGTTESGALDASAVWSRLETDPEESASLAIDVDGVWFTCYFFDLAEIEFTFDPSDVVDDATFAPVCAFVTWLGDPRADLGHAPLRPRHQRPGHRRPSARLERGLRLRCGRKRRTRHRSRPRHPGRPRVRRHPGPLGRPNLVRLRRARPSDPQDPQTAERPKPHMDRGPADAGRGTGR